jgi:hypothetical protein
LLSKKIPLVNVHKSLREFYIIIYLNKLKLHVVENTPKNEKNKNKTSMAKASGPSEIPNVIDRYLYHMKLCPGHMRGGFSRCIGSVPEEPRRGP